MTNETQEHMIRGTSEKYVITRNGRHQYRYVRQSTRHVYEEGYPNPSPWLPSVTTIASHIGGDNFSMAMNWGLKQVRESAVARITGLDVTRMTNEEFKKHWDSVGDNALTKGDLEAPKQSGAEARDSGNKLHQDIDNFIKHPLAPQPEDNDLFMLWHRELGGRKWIASEQFFVHTGYQYGGTADALSMEEDGVAIWDWKTKAPKSYHQYGGTAAEAAQLTAYALAMQDMDHVFAPVKGYIAYIMRDGSGVDVQPVDITSLGRNAKLFRVGVDMYRAMNDLKQEAKDKTKDPIS